jgi:hypothetical protein
VRKLLLVAALGEAVTGLTLFVSPAIVVSLLFGGPIDGAGVVISRVAGISLVALGVACRPSDGITRAIDGMLSYSTLAMLYLAYLGVRGEDVGVLLWPGVAAHAILAGLLVRARLSERR